ncbi:Hypothetical_protein [Hexamita inflata]|uniref:Hypothetical_protein n=1 Tax=Hexamita inflata TaxID=28002 RepID=A0AA86UL13_9EUKA|nr:Hypothetical protein HINF_LOCUS43052 [Hexamita inflata]
MPFLYYIKKVNLIVEYLKEIDDFERTLQASTEQLTLGSECFGKNLTGQFEKVFSWQIQWDNLKRIFSFVQEVDDLRLDRFQHHTTNHQKLRIDTKQLAKKSPYYECFNCISQCSFQIPILLDIISILSQN